LPVSKKLKEKVVPKFSPRKTRNTSEDGSAKNFQTTRASKKSVSGA
jgi:hypothetical protein